MSACMGRDQVKLKKTKRYNNSLNPFDVQIETDGHQEERDTVCMFCLCCSNVLLFELSVSVFEVI